MYTAEMATANKVYIETAGHRSAANCLLKLKFGGSAFHLPFP